MIREANKNDLDEILQLYYKRATMEDIDELVRTRIIVLRAANKLSDDEDMSVVVSAFIRLCRPIIIRQVKMRIL